MKRVILWLYVLGVLWLLIGRATMAVRWDWVVSNGLYWICWLTSTEQWLPESPTFQSVTSGGYSITAIYTILLFLFSIALVVVVILYALAVIGTWSEPEGSNANAEPEEES